MPGRKRAKKDMVTMSNARTGWVSRALKRLLVIVVAGLLLPAAASAAPPPLGGLVPLPGATGCFATTATGSCQAANGLFGAESATVSPDGKFVYAGSYKIGEHTTPGLAAFERDPATGRLTQLPGTAGCYTLDGSSQAGPNTCTKVEGLGSGDGRDFAITSDGRWAYMVNQGSVNNTGAPPASIVIFQRDPSTGVLTQPAAPNGCISQTGASQDASNGCQTLSTIDEPNGITLSSDDRFAYVTDFGSTTSGIHVLQRDPATGALTEIQCLSDASPPPAGCTAARRVGDVQSLVITPDGLHAYAANYNDGISILDRDPATGKLTQKTGTAGCMDDDGSGGCALGRALRGAYALAVSPDGHTLYVSAYSDNGVAILHINADGSLTQLAGTAGCTTLNGNDGSGQGLVTCATGRALEGPYGDAVSPDGHTLYVTELPPGSTRGGVAIFSIDPATGAITQLPGTSGCLTADGTSNGVAGACAVGGPALAGAYTPSLSPDGSSLYVAAYFGEALSTLAVERGPACQAATASTAYQTPVSVAVSCTDADGDPLTTAIVTGPAHGTLGAVAQSTGTLTYAPAAGYSGTDSFTFDASDGTNVSAPVTATISIGAPPAVPPPTPAPALITQARPPASLTGAHQSHRMWREGNALATISNQQAPVGTAFSFTLNETARVTLTFTQAQPGRKVNGKCVAPTRRNAAKRKCTRTVTAGTITFTGHAGTNKLAFDGRVNRHSKLAPGTYTLIISATAPGGAATPQRLTFTIVK
jgi:6-phosphogluconolactonase (cycloisomerase 2 family)